MTQLNLNNKYRVVLTEILPYEVPLLFDNDSFYQILNEEKKEKIFNGQLNIVTQHRNEKWYIPFNYKVRKYGGEHSRSLSIIHPLNQKDLSDFYEQYANYMLYLCNRSPFSIRHISRISKCIFDISDSALDQNNNDVELTLNLDDDEELDSINGADLQSCQKYRSYFVYEKYDRLYKFFDSIEQVRLEQKYKFCMKLDLSKCFYHIYTHSIAWAVKGKEYAKDNQRAISLECKFDELMQHCNYNETNGIVVGPEFSRIFAEIILQRIDLDILDELKKFDIILGKDYDIRRYVDDYFIFANDETKFEIIKKVCEEKCEPYKLYINEKKIQIIKRPLSTDLSVAKKEVKELIEQLNEKYFSVTEEGNYKTIFRDSSKGLTNFARKYSSIAHQNNIHYAETNRFCLSLIESIIKKELRRGIVPSEGQILSFVEISFYLFSLDMNASGSVRISSIIDMLVDWNRKIIDKDERQNIMDRLYRESKRCFDIYTSTSKDDQTNIEILNLLIALRKKTDFDINGDLIKRIFNLKLENDLKIGFEKLNYFQICTILYILENNDPLIRSALTDEIKKRFNKFKDPFAYSELTLLYFDILACPYIDMSTKIEIYTIAQKKNNCPRKRAEYESCVNRIAKVKKWFFDWDKNNNLSDLIRKKMYNSTYQ